MVKGGFVRRLREFLKERPQIVVVYRFVIADGDGQGVPYYYEDYHIARAVHQVQPQEVLALRFDDGSTFLINSSNDDSSITFENPTVAVESAIFDLERLKKKLINPR